MTVTNSQTLGSIAGTLGLECTGEPDRVITGLATLRSATASQLSFYTNARYQEELKATAAGGVIIAAEFRDDCPVPALISTNPYLSFAQATKLFAPQQAVQGGIHPSATVSEDAEIDASAEIGPQVVIEGGVRIGPRVRVGAGCFIGRDTLIGADSRLFPNVTVCHGVQIGERVILHPAAVIGGDGFGFAHDGRQHLRIEQLGTVILEDDVEVGACTTVDRGALDDTVIEAGAKIDNLVQVAHNVRIGRQSIVCGCVGIAGSATIGANCIIAGGVGVLNHATITDGVTVTGMSFVHKDITEKGMYSSGTGMTDTSLWRRNMLRFAELDKMAKQLRQLLKKTG